jgi:glutamate--cysteine ligase
MLFGAAPAVCRSFVKGRKHNLEAFGDDDHSLHTAGATSLRMGDLGYQSNAQQSLSVCYNRLDNYMNTLTEAIGAEHSDYAAIGLKDEQGHFQQLNTSLLQIENEFYSPIRPKRPANTGETALTALKRGVEYIEVRCIDLNPFEPLGINEEQIRFIDSFLLFCLLNESPDSDLNESQRIAENQSRVVYRGRDPQLMLKSSEGEISARDWAHALLNEIDNAAQLLDSNRSDNANQQSINSQRDKLAGKKAFPAQAILEQMHDQQQTFYGFAEQQAVAHKDYFLSRPLDTEKSEEFSQLAKDSLALQNALEQADTGSFSGYLADYYQQYG